MKKNKEPGLFRQLVAIHYEQAKRRKAIRQLAKAEWSMEFLSEVVVQAAKQLNKNVEIEVVSKSGNRIRVNSVSDRRDILNTDNDIFNRLDDTAAVERFIRENSRR